MRYMEGWTWSQFLATPSDVIDRMLVRATEEEAKRKEDAEQDPRYRG